MASYCARYIKDYATLSYPIRELPKQGQPFHWSSMCDKAFSEIKTAIESATNLAYFIPRWKTELTVDVSPVCLGPILAQ